jgi:nucleotide-binding universal stress UspA family protein
MYTKMLVPLDGSKTAEQVLPYARLFADRFNKPVELIAVIDIGEIMAYVSPEKAVYLYDMIHKGERRSEAYLRKIADTFHDVTTDCVVQRGHAEEVIIDRAEGDTGMLITMATHGRSGLNRWLLGSVTEKILRGTANPLLVIRAKENSTLERDPSLKSILVPLDGSTLAEKVLPVVAALAKKLDLAVILFRSYYLPYNVEVSGSGYFAVNVQQLVADASNDVRSYLEEKAAEIKKLGVESISCVTREGLNADEIIKMGRKTPGCLIAMCSHGRSGVKRWALGSVTETVVRHCDNPVLVLRPG